MKQASIQHKAEVETPERQEAVPSDAGSWSPRTRMLALIGCAIASWVIVGLVGYGLYSLLA